MKRWFERTLLVDVLDLPAQAVEDDIVSRQGSVITRRIIFQYEGSYWRAYYSYTILQGHGPRPWHNEAMIECVEVERVAQTSVQWLPKPDRPYIDRIAERIHAISPDRDDPIAWDLFRIYAVLALAKGTSTTTKDVHDAWSAWIAASKPQHKSLIPFDELTETTQNLDFPYVLAIHNVARELV